MSLFTTAATAGHGPLLRYQPADGQTNVYNVHIDIRGEYGTESLVGTVLLIPRAMSSNVIALNFRGALYPRRDHRQPYPHGPTRWSTPITVNDACEVLINDRGDILRISGDSLLPIPLGSVAQLFINRFPAGSQLRHLRWGSTNELVLVDEPFALGPGIGFFNSPWMPMPYFGGYNPRNTPGLLAATRKVRYEQTNGAPGDPLIRKTVTLATRHLTGSEPRISATADGELLLDRHSGALRRSEMEFITLVHTESVIRRTAGSLRIHLLAGEDRDKALESLLPRPAAVLTPERVRTLMTDLAATEANTRSEAANQLQIGTISNPPPALIEMMTGFLSHSDSALRNAAVRIIADHGTREHLPALLKLLGSGDSYNRQHILRGLGRLKDARAIEPLAAFIARGQDPHQAAETLARFGPEAEDTALSLLREKHLETRRAACSILKEVGTSKSVEPLKELMLDPDNSLSSAATEAVRAILARL